jgi:hypothetical protein
MLTWAEFADAAPELAAEGRRLLRLDGQDQGFLATLRGDDLPRIHPVYVGVVGDRLYTFVSGGKRKDLESDGRYALHAHQDQSVPHEFAVRGRARTVDDPAERSRVAAAWSFEPDDSFGLFELRVAAALVGRRDSPDDWPPQYTSWSAAKG